MFRRLVLLIAGTLPLSAADVRVVEEIAAKVNGEIVTRGELMDRRKEIENELKAKGLSGAQLQAAVNQQSAEALRDKIDELLLVQKAKDFPNITVDGDISRWVAGMQVAAKISDSDKFAEWVRQQFGVTLEDLKQRQKNSLLAQRVVQYEVGSRVNISEAERQKYYEEHKADFVREEEIFLSQIVVSTEGKTPEEAAAAETKAKQLVARARQGDKFSELATANSDDTATAGNGGYLGSPYKRGDLRPEIANLVFTQKKGYVTDPIKIPTGFVILKVEDRHEAGQATYEQVKDEIQNILAAPKMEPKVRDYLTRLREEAFLEIRDGYVDAGAAPGKDTTWHDVAQIKPQTTTKEEVAARKRKKILWLIPYGYAGPAKPAAGATETVPAAKPAAETAPAAKSPAAAPENPVKK
jgi:parvulin-like peptidyl-prolyl isomerase